MITIEAIEKLETDLSSKISGVLDLQSLEATRIELLGKKVSFRRICEALEAWLPKIEK